jgi:hypothetical protein
VYDVAETNPVIAKEPSLFRAVKIFAAGVEVTTYWMTPLSGDGGWVNRSVAAVVESADAVTFVGADGVYAMARMGRTNCEVDINVEASAYRASTNEPVNARDDCTMLELQ